MDINNMSKEELENLQKQLTLKQEEIKQGEIKKAQTEAGKHIDLLRDNRELIMKLIEHDRSSCSDTCVCNGYGSATYGARCAKCHLIEILNGECGNRFDVEFSINIIDTEN